MPTNPIKRTALYENHVALKGRIVPFAGWEMPVQYTSILEEARAVRSKGGIFDVSHMGRIYISGSQATELLDWLQTGNIGSLREGRARYSLICDEKGGIIDDTVTYRLTSDRYLLVCNASNRDGVLNWINHWRYTRFPETTLDDVTLKTAMIALQGPTTASLMDELCPQKPSSIRYFSRLEGTIAGRKVFMGRTGYTGEDGFELILDAAEASQMWEILLDHQMIPCGLWARDVLRLEAGLALHGNDIDQNTSPLEARLERFVRLEKNFVGAEKLRHQQEVGVTRELVGLLVEGRNLPRHDYPIEAEGNRIGHVTSGGYSPTLDRNIAMGYVPHEFASHGKHLQVDIRGRLADATVTSLPFYVRKREP